MYKARLKKGHAFFVGGLNFKWSEATQEQLKAVYEMGDNDLVELVKDAAPKKTKAKKSEASDQK
jgi:hypothetical protein